MDYSRMTRRDALKCMNASVAKIALAYIGGLSLLSSCMNNGKKRIVFYFTATGNSLFAAKHFSNAPLSIPQVIKQSDLTFEADEIGFVFPDYRASAPEIVKRFLHDATFKAHYMFSIITYGKWDCNVIESWNKYAIQNGVHFNYITSVLMVDNYLPVFDMNEEIRMDKKENEQLQKVVADISEEKEYIPQLSAEERKRCEDILKILPSLFPVRCETLFEINDDCIGCGFCKRVCPRSNFKLGNKGVEFSGDCEHCLACVQNCPQKAISLKNGELNKNARYRHPRISLNEIVRSNIQ